MAKEILYNTKMEKMTDFSSILLRSLLKQQVTLYSPSHYCKSQQTANIVELNVGWRSWDYL